MSDHATVTGDLAADLTRAVRGEVRFGDGDRALYATAGSNYSQLPIGVVIPRDLDDVRAGISVCRDHDVPVLGRGGGTSLAGQCCNVAVVFDFSKYLHHVVELDPDRKVARVQPGTILDSLRDAAEVHHLTFGPDPATHNHCTLGGMIGNNSCGAHSVMAGKTVDNVESLDVLLYDGTELRVGPTGDEELELLAATGGRKGEIYRRLRELRDRHADQIREHYPQIPRRVSGYNLDELLPERGFNLARALVGSEGTCATVLEATVRLVDSPPARNLLVLGFDDVYAAADRIPDLLDSGCIGLEGLDQFLVDDVKRKGMHPQRLSKLPDGHGWLMLEFGGETAGKPTSGRSASSTRHGAGTTLPTFAATTTTRRRRRSGRSVSPVSVPPRAYPASPTRGKAGRTPPCPRSASASTCGACASCTTGTATRAPSMATSDRDACTPGSTSTCSPRTASASGAPSWRTRRTSSSSSAARCPVSTATVSHAPSSFPRCSARSSSTRSVTSSRSGTPAGA